MPAKSKLHQITVTIDVSFDVPDGVVVQSLAAAMLDAAKRTGVEYLERCYCGDKALMRSQDTGPVGIGQAIVHGAEGML